MRRKKMKLPALDKTLQLKYVNKWKANHELFLNNVFGLKDGPQILFLTGILFATSSSKHLALLLQPVIQADGAHSSFWQVHVLFGICNDSQWEHVSSCVWSAIWK